jgi:hypothetical protein
MSDDPEKDTRRWLPAVLRIFALMAGVALFFWLGWSLHRVRERARMIEVIQAAGGQVFEGQWPGKSLPLGWWLCGARHIFLVRMPIGVIDQEATANKSGAWDEGMRIEALFPEAASVDFFPNPSTR